MKKTCICLIISFLAFRSMAQITISGSTTYPVLNMTFAPASSVPPTDCYITFNDAGTNVYKATVIFPAVGMTPGYTVNYYISRRNNYWHIEGFSSFQLPHQYYVYYVSQSTSTDINPPCNAVWKIFTGYCVPSYGFSLAYTGITTSTLVLSGYCTCPVSLSTTVNPSHIQLPLLDTPSLAAISPPKKGMLTFSMDSHRPKIYDGFQWANLVQDKGNVTLGGTLTAQGMNVTGSIITPVYVPTGNFTVDATMHHIFYAGAGGHSCTLPTATAITGREYFITNQGGGSLTFSQTIKTGQFSSISSCVPGITIHIIYDGGQWRLVN